LSRFKPDLSFPLFLAKESEEVRITEIRGRQQFKEKCINQGLIPGQTMTIISNTGSGPCLVFLLGSRIMIGRGMLGRIFVEK
jgi:Fe2+ transport system protein FeoA